jgi:hypothetical protein
MDLLTDCMMSSTVCFLTNLAFLSMGLMLDIRWLDWFLRKRRFASLQHKPYNIVKHIISEENVFKHSIFLFHREEYTIAAWEAF